MDSYSCDICVRSFTRKYHLKRHVENVHGIIKKESFVEYAFDTKQDFMEWKSKMELETLSLYISERSVNKSGTMKYHYYECSRSGTYEPAGETKRMLKSQGTSKIGRRCPSRLVVHEREKVFVKFFNKHEGHGIDLEHLRLPRTSRESVAGKLKEGVEMKRIIDDIREEAVSTKIVTRSSLISTKDLRNIKDSCKISNQRHKVDCVSVRLWVDEMRMNGDANPVIYYKEQGNDDSRGFVTKDDFVLIFMTNSQKDILKRFGSNKICVDGTHGLNPYDFTLHTILTVDEYGNGFPVCFCFSNRCNEELLVLVFSELKAAVGKIECNIFMTDDAPAYCNAWERVMGPVPHTLLCSWHVSRNWGENLSKISNSEKKKIVFKSLKTLRDETDIEKFHVMMENLIQDLNDDDETRAFGKYFIDRYSNRPEKWAYCHRLRLGINTNMYLESLHKRIKYHYLDGKVVRRLDVAIDALMKLVRDLIFERMIKITKNTRSEKIRSIQASHLKGMSINEDCIASSVDSIEVKSVAYEGRSYEIVKCSEETICCEMKCDVCNICIHAYKCTCADNVIKFNICKHIHACAMRSGHNPINPRGDDFKNKEVSRLIEQLPVFSNESENSENKNRELINLAHQLIENLSTRNYDEQGVSKIEKTLRKCVFESQELALEYCSTSVEPNLKRKVDKQLPLFSTKKKNTKTSCLKNPTHKEVDSIREGLLNGRKVMNIHTDFDHTYLRNN